MASLGTTVQSAAGNTVVTPPSPGENVLVARVFERCDAVIGAACARSSVPAAFLGALTANESAGNAKAARFEPAVYQHLQAVARGERPAYGSITRGALGAEVAELLHPKADDFHPRYLNASFAARHASEISAAEDEIRRELATSWGYTQIMGYHLIGRSGSLQNLLDPPFHFHLALQLLGEFAADYDLDLGREFREMFACWNTGRPYGETYDPDYIEKGLRRMEIYQRLATSRAA